MPLYMEVVQLSHNVISITFYTEDLKQKDLEHYEVVNLAAYENWNYNLPMSTQYI